MKLIKKINLNINRFRFKWWSWDVDISRSALLLFVILSLLPVLPYEREDGELTVLGIPASVDNFYDLGIKAFNSEKKLAFKEGSIGYQLTKLAEFPIPNFIAYKKHLISKGASEDLATCIIRRDMVFLFGIQYMEGTKILYEYPPSPVPAIWMYRSIHSNILSYISQPSTSPWRNVFENVSKKCAPFKYIGPSSDLMEKLSFGLPEQ